LLRRRHAVVRLIWRCVRGRDRRSGFGAGIYHARILVSGICAPRPRSCGSRCRGRLSLQRLHGPIQPEAIRRRSASSEPIPPRLEAAALAPRSHRAARISRPQRSRDAARSQRRFSLKAPIFVCIVSHFS
jgi:hypothetical protein